MKDTTGHWAALGRAVLFMVSCAVILAVASPIGSKFPGTWPELIAGTLASLGAFALTLLFVRWEKLSLADVGAAMNGRSLLRMSAGFFLGLFLVALWAALSAVTSPIQWVRGSGGGVPAVMLALSAYVVLACREELAFRGYPLRLLNRLFGPWFALIFVAAIFALEHKLGGLSGLPALVGAAVGSLLFGMAALATRGLAVPIGLHAAWNFGQWALGLRGGQTPWRRAVMSGSQHSVDLAGTILYLAVFGVATLGFWLWRRAHVSG
jgi:membrane protease YdiL (CAAX protease family)